MARLLQGGLEHPRLLSERPDPPRQPVQCLAGIVHQLMELNGAETHQLLPMISCHSQIYSGFPPV